METILILHGWGSRAEKWSKVKKLLENHGYNVLVPDLPGFGENPILSRPWSMDDYVGWVKEYCDKNNLFQIILAGHSFGGGLAASFSSKFSGEIKKLILVDSAIIRVKYPQMELLARIAKILKVFSFLPFYKLIRKFFYKFVISDYVGLEGAMRETYLGVVKKDLSGCLSFISVPTLLIWGKEDKITPLKDAWAIKERIVGSKIEIMPNVKHCPYLEAPEILVEKIVNFIKL
ncbi:MAG: alpha/beta hydrolase [Candidatus Nealsonbacteria bacterium]